MTSFLSVLVGADAAAYVLRNARTNGTVASRLLPAFDAAARNTGLLKHSTLEPGAAMLIAPSNAVHTFFMRFPIDLLFVGKDGRVLKIREAVPAWRMAACLRGHAVIEMAAHSVRAADLRVGDQLLVAPVGA